MIEPFEQLHKTLEEIENSFIKIAAHREELDIYGLKRISRWLDLPRLLPVLDRFPIELSAAADVLKIIDRQRYDQLNELLAETKLEDLISRFSVRIRISEHERPSINIFYEAFSALRLVFLRPSSIELFSDADVTYESVLSAISRIRTSIRIANDEIESRMNQDDEIFRPSNLDANQITIQIDQAIIAIQKDSWIGFREREKLIEYLEQAKGELSKKQPSWKMIVGALAIASTILGGIAVAPEAAENVQGALDYILGTSMETSESKILQLSSPEISLKPALTDESSI